MAAVKQFCAEESIRAGDPLPGTATHPEHNLLLSWPRRYWERNLRHANNMPPSVRERLDQLATSGRRTNLIYRREDPEDSHRILMYPERLAFDIQPEQLEAFLDDVQQGRNLAQWSGTPVANPVILCCTHGKKDKCCARFGYATYRRLKAEIESGDLPIDLWESSHLGGCRLAASLISFPSRRKYGRVDSNHTRALLDQEISDRAYLPCYRGSGALAPAQQCAEIGALDWLARHDVDVDWLDVGSVPGDTVHHSLDIRVRWSAAESRGVLVAQCLQQQVLRVDTCADLDAGPSSSSCWVVTGVTPEHRTTSTHRS